jgi:hypothetical protein
MSSSNKSFGPSVAVSTSNKLVYIARIEAKYTERDVCEIIEDFGVGRAIYVDFTAVKDNSAEAGPNPAFKFYSAFVMMSEWNPRAYDDMIRNGYLKVWTTSHKTSYFMLRQAKEGTEIPRTKVNIHQLAAYTAELYEKVGASDKKVELAEKKAELAEKKAELAEKKAELADQKIAEMMTVLNDMVAKMGVMSNQIGYMDGFLTAHFAVKEEVSVAEDNLS